jgi:hypothetical protein
MIPPRHPFRRRFPPLAATLLAGLAAACQSPAPGAGHAGAAAPAPVASAFLTPAPGHAAAQPIRHSTTLASSSKSWVAADGTRHTRSSRSSASVSVDPNAMGSAVAMLLGAAMSQPAAATAPLRSADIAGDWQVDIDGKQCRMSLRPTGAAPTGFASTFGCLGTEMQGVTGWSLRGNEVVLTGMFDKRVAVLGLSGPRRMDGDTDGAATVVAWR